MSNEYVEGLPEAVSRLKSNDDFRIFLKGLLMARENKIVSLYSSKETRDQTIGWIQCFDDIFDIYLEEFADSINIFREKREQITEQLTIGNSPQMSTVPIPQRGKTI